jgi:hypothetical protein
MSIEWYFIYSQRYYPYDLYLKDVIPLPFEAKGIFVDQSVFDEHLYKHANEHPLSRMTVKIENIIHILEEKLENTIINPFFFTDVDLVVRPSASTNLLPYTEKTGFDIYLQRENMTTQIGNCGFMLIWPTKASLVFWKSVLQAMRESTNDEMTVINEVLSTNSVVFGLFEPNDVASPITINQQTLQSFSVYHLLSGTRNRFDDFHEKFIQSQYLVQDMGKYFYETIQKYGKLHH